MVENGSGIGIGARQATQFERHVFAFPIVDKDAEAERERLQKRRELMTVSSPADEEPTDGTFELPLLSSGDIRNILRQSRPKHGSKDTPAFHNLNIDSRWPDTTKKQFKPILPERVCIEETIEVEEGDGGECLLDVKPEERVPELSDCSKIAELVTPEGVFVGWQVGADIPTPPLFVLP